MTTSTTLLILGASGDLTHRLLLPGLGSLLQRDPDRPLRIVGADRADLTNEAFLDRLCQSLADGGAGPEVVARHRKRSSYHQLDVTDSIAFGELLSSFDSERTVIYFALPPAVTRLACQALLSVKLPPQTHLALEKPFGTDRSSARELNTLASHLVPDYRVHRVDHFLGKSTVLDVMALRFSNRMIQQVWSADHIESIEITYDEALALEGRAGYYDHAGAMVDMIQSHLLQVMAVVMMEAPSQVSDRELREAKSAVLRATRLWGGDPATASRRGRYTAGTIAGRAIPDYLSEEGVDPKNETETMAQITVEVANQRWAGIPITLRSGKALGQTQKQVVVTFADVRHLPEGLHSSPGKDQLIVGLSSQVMELHLTTSRAEDALALEQSVFTASLRRPEVSAYGEVLAAILDGEVLLSVSGSAAEECWRIIDEVLAAWHQGASPIEDYPAGSAVPEHWQPQHG